ncbi:hypothetical protein Slin15195_G110860 [Septoria linicola]|uniref:Antifreeze glycoprotein n=1 Tax=Septoria linicola TaxID=215465 RepID=A0A9Q9EPI9_9PEZI|nr:hypothetical protein Slin15195_G110860 [Septoria linicola]
MATTLNVVLLALIANHCLSTAIAANTDPVCVKSQSDYLPLSTYSPAQTFCSRSYPVAPSTTTRTVTSTASGTTVTASTVTTTVSTRTVSAIPVIFGAPFSTITAPQVTVTSEVTTFTASLVSTTKTVTLAPVTATAPTSTITAPPATQVNTETDTAVVTTTSAVTSTTTVFANAKRGLEARQGDANASRFLRLTSLGASSASTVCSCIQTRSTVTQSRITQVALTITPTRTIASFTVTVTPSSNVTPRTTVTPTITVQSVATFSPTSTITRTSSPTVTVTPSTTISPTTTTVTRTTTLQTTTVTETASATTTAGPRGPACNDPNNIPGGGDCSSNACITGSAVGPCGEPVCVPVDNCSSTFTPGSKRRRTSARGFLDVVRRADAGLSEPNGAMQLFRPGQS